MRRFFAFISLDIGWIRKTTRRRGNAPLTQPAKMTTMTRMTTRRITMMDKRSVRVTPLRLSIAPQHTTSHTHHILNEPTQSQSLPDRKASTPAIDTAAFPQHLLYTCTTSRSKCTTPFKISVSLSVWFSRNSHPVLVGKPFQLSFYSRQP